MNTDTAPLEPTPTKKWWKRWWVWGCLTLLGLVAVMVIATLAGIAIVRMGGALDDAGPATAKAQLANLNVALLSYKAKAGFYPTQIQGLQSLATKPTKPPLPARWTSIMDSIPRDPWGHPFVYRVPSTDAAMAYDLFSLGRDGVPSADDISTSAPLPPSTGPASLPAPANPQGQGFKLFPLEPPKVREPGIHL